MVKSHVPNNINIGAHQIVQSSTAKFNKACQGMRTQAVEVEVKPLRNINQQILAELRKMRKAVEK